MLKCFFINGYTGFGYMAVSRSPGLNNGFGYMAVSESPGLNDND